MRERSLLKRLAARLARDRPIDWDAEERGVQSEDERATVREMRVFAALAAFHRVAQTADAASDLATSISIAQSVAGPLRTSTIRPSREPELPTGSRWGHLEIFERVGGGAFGDVYRARDTRLDRVVALKLVAPQTIEPTDEGVREARLLARVRHPHVVTVYGADRVDGRIGIWMEFLEGQTLEQILQNRGPLDAREAALIGIDLCRALSAVHAAGITHRDIKLSNVMRAVGGRIVLMDFGLGREIRQRGEIHAVSGTPLFMAPEVLRGARADARSDIYSVGVVLFSLVTGTQPVLASSVPSLKSKHERGEVRRARDLRADLPEHFAHVLDRALAPDPQQRYATPGEVEQGLLQALGTAVRPEVNTRARPPRSRILVAAGGATLLAMAMILGVMRSRDRSPAPSESPPAAPLPEVPSLTLTGEHDGDMFGLAMAAVGDVDQDGFDDVLVGAPHCDDGKENAGKIYWYRGTRNGLEEKAAWTATGEAQDAVLGWSMASFTNLSFDGFDDLVVGMPGMGVADSHILGKVLIYPGSATGPARAPSQKLVATQPGTLFGCAVATGDVNHDGHDDLLVGEPYFPTLAARNGRVHLYLADGGRYSEKPAQMLTGPPDSGFGIRVSLADLNGDGYADAAIGATVASFGAELPNCGAAYVYLGSLAGLDSVPTVLPGRQASEGFGLAFFAGDLDADGFADLVVGAEGGSHGEESEGIAEIYFGSREGISSHGSLLLESNTMGANFGGHGGGAGDLDGDGCDDLFIGALRYQKTQPRAGAAYLFRGSKDRRIRQSWFHTLEKSGSWYGTAGGNAGDVNGDGFPDLMVSAGAWDTDRGENVGQVQLFLNARKP